MPQNYISNFVACTLVFMCGAADAQEDESIPGAGAPDRPNFRNFRWYDHIDTVTQRETAKFLEYRDHEMLVVIDPPKKQKAEHLYFEDILLGKPVRVLYRFDLECKQLWGAHYIFENRLDYSSIYKLIGALERKYEVELILVDTGENIGALGPVDEETFVGVYQKGDLYFFPGSSTVSYESKKSAPLTYGWRAGSEPTCAEKEAIQQELQKKL